MQVSNVFQLDASSKIESEKVKPQTLEHDVNRWT
jgi:hypothetical protein